MPDASQAADADDLYSPPLQAWREEGRGRRIAPDAVWAAARDDYLAGMSAPEVCDRHGLRLATLRARAAREGWRRIDQPWAPSNRLDPDDEGVALEARVGGDLDKIDLYELSDVALRRMLRAVLRGDAVGALRWRRVREVIDAEEAEMERDARQREAIWASRRDLAGIDSFDSSDALDGVFGVADDRDDPAFPDPESRDIVAP